MNKKIYFSNCYSVRKNLKTFYFQTNNLKIQKTIAELVLLLNDEIELKRDEIQNEDKEFYNSLMSIYDFM